MSKQLYVSKRVGPFLGRSDGFLGALSWRLTFSKSVSHELG